MEISSLLQSVFQIFGILAGVGITAAGFGFAYTQFTSGGNKSKDELIATLKETALAEKDKADRLAAEKTIIVISHQQQITDLTEKMGKLQGLFEASENQKNEYRSILQGMSPEEVQYRKDMRSFTSGVAQYMKDSSEVFVGMKEFLTKMSEGIVQNNIFNSQIAEDTKSGEGEVLRKKV